ncbi:MAG TPA: class I SAM-dependent methyltransferase [Bacteroidales bacterium]|nr:class I SAM-dependent methyltransferase [Bacteroidales bacterium]
MDRSVFEKIHQLQKNGFWFGAGRNRITLSLLEKHDEKLGSHTILDIGSSEGAFLDYLNNHHLKFRGIDIDENALEFCRERGYGNHVQYGDIKDIPFPENSYSVATALDIVEHVDNDLKAMKEISRVLVKDGIALVIVPAYQWLWSRNDEAYHHQRRYSKKQFMMLTSNSGLKTEQWSYFNFFLFPVFILATLVSKFFPGKVKTSTVLKPLPKPFNYLLKQIMYFETWMISRLGIRFPFGSSIIFVLRKIK